MSTLDTAVASVSGAEVTVRSLLRKLQVEGQLVPLLREAMVTEFLTGQARGAGIAATAEELQATADAFRRRHGLHSAAETRAWLERHHLSVLDFEANLERELHVAKLRDRVPAEKVEAAFAASPTDFDSIRVAQTVVPREDQARELVTQVQEDGREFADVVREHGLALTHVMLHRRQVGDGLAKAKPGQVVGPTATAEGFVLSRIEAVTPATLDAATRAMLGRELFDQWLASRLQDARLDLTALGAG